MAGIFTANPLQVVSDGENETGRLPQVADGSELTTHA